MAFKIGDKVTVIDEDLKGVVVAIDGKWVEIQCEDGFNYRYPETALCKISAEGELSFIPADFKAEVKEADQPKLVKGIRPINFSSSKTVFDLHMEELFPDKMPAKNDISLNIQLDYAEAVLNKAIHLKVRQLVFVHGRGQGVLRDELRKMMRKKFPNAEFFDGDYRKFGQGATEVIIHGLGSL